jgi:serine/threonine-protein kinase HipA
VKKLDVLFRGWGQNWILGTLADVGGKVHFAFSGEALQRGVEHSPYMLPLSRETRTGFPAHLNGLPGFINDALPDGWGMLLMDRMFRQLGRDPRTVSPLDRLSFIGDRAMGALSFRPSADLDLTHEDLSLLELANAARDIVQDGDVTALKTLAIVGGSPHGARPKALVQFDTTTHRISTRDDAPGAPWMVKFQAASEHKEVCAIESTYARLARDCGLDIPEARHFDLDKSMAAFAVRRFDRVGGLRVPVQSVAAALHTDFRLPSIDYEQLLQITRRFTQDVREIIKAYESCVFNVVFNNRDDHAKNFAFCMAEDLGWCLSPAYDLTFSSGPGGQHQTSVVGAGEPTRADLLRLAHNSGIDRKVAEATIDRMCANAGSLQPLLTDHDVRASTIKEILKAVNGNVSRCASGSSVALRLGAKPPKPKTPVRSLKKG